MDENKIMGVLRCLVKQAADKCEDADLLDLVYKLLAGSAGRK